MELQKNSLLYKFISPRLDYGKTILYSVTPSDDDRINIRIVYEIYYLHFRVDT